MMRNQTSAKPSLKTSAGKAGARNSQKKKAVVLLSGGLDSATVLAIALKSGYECHALSFSYGQRHSREIGASKRIAKHYGTTHKVVKVGLRDICQSALTDDGIDVPKNRPGAKRAKEIPSTYVPARNTIFLALAIGYAESIGAEAVFIGANALDYSGYPDCRQEYLEAFQKVAELGTKAGAEGGRKIKIMYPLVKMRKSEIIRKGTELGVPYHLTWSCYSGGRAACGECDSCIIRLRGFKSAGRADPIGYEKNKR